MTEEQKKAYTGRRRGRPAKKKKGRKNQEDEQKRIEKDILAIERQIARANGEPIPRTIEECVISEDESKPRRNYFGRFNKKNDGETPVKQEEEYSGQEEADEDGNGQGLLQKRSKKAHDDDLYKIEEEFEEDLDEDDSYVPATNKKRRKTKSKKDSVKKKLKTSEQVNQPDLDQLVIKQPDFKTSPTPQPPNPGQIVTSSRSARKRRSTGVFQKQLQSKELFDADGNLIEKLEA